MLLRLLLAVFLLATPTAAGFLYWQSLEGGGSLVSSHIKPLQNGRPDAVSGQTEQAEPQRHVFTDIVQSGEAVIAVGERGQIWRSTDQGENWTPASTGVDALLTATAFFSIEEGLAVGHRGTVLRTSDSGQTWSRIALPLEHPERFTALDVTFVNEQSGYIVGSQGLILETHNRGHSWQKSSFPETGENLNAVIALPSGRTIVVSDRGDIYFKTPKSKHWKEADTPFFSALNGALSTGIGDGVIVYGADGTVLHSGDGGESWSRLKAASKVHYYSGLRAADGSIVLGGEHGILVRRTPDQQMFYLEENHPTGAVLSMVESTAGNLIIAGIQGLGRLADDRYRFVDDHLGLTGQLRTRQLLAQRETQELLMHAENAGLTQDGYPALHKEWFRLDAVATDQTSLLSPKLFPQIGGLYESLVTADEAKHFTLVSLWVNLNTVAGSKHIPFLPGVKSGEAFNEADSQALSFWVRQAAIEGFLIDRASRRVSFHVLPQTRWSTHNNPTDVEQTEAFLNRLYQTQHHESFELQPPQRMTLASLAAPAQAAEPSMHEQSSRYIYSLTYEQSALSHCDLPTIWALADRLDLPLRAIEGVKTTLSVAEIAKEKEASSMNNWKWYTPPSPQIKRSGHPSTWIRRYGCIHTIALVYGEKGAPNITDTLSATVKQVVGSNLAQEVHPEIVVRPYQSRAH